MTQYAPAGGDGLPAPGAEADEGDPWGLTPAPSAEHPAQPMFPTAAGLATAEYLEPEVPAPDAPASNEWATAWPATVPPAQPASGGGSSRRTLFVAMAVLIGVVAVLGVVVGLSSSSPTSKPQPAPAPAPATSAPAPAPRHPAAAPDLQIAQAVNLAPADVPTGWAPDPVSPFFASPSSGSGGASASPADKKAAHTLETCLGIPPSEDPLGPSGLNPVTSPAYRQPTPTSVTTEMQSGTEVLTSGEVTRDLGVLSMPRFTNCFGQAMVGLFSDSSSNGGAQIGTPRITPITLEQVPGTHAAGVEIAAPVTASGTSSSLDMQIVFVAGGRLETLLMGASVGQPFPLLVTARAAYDIEHRVAADGSSAGA